MPLVALHQRQEVLLLSAIEASQRSGGRQLAQFGILASHLNLCSAVCVVSHRKARYSVQEINILQLDKHQVSTIKNKEERYSRVPRLSDTRYSAKRTKGKWSYASSKARIKCATYRRQADLSVMGLRVGVFFLDQSIGIDETNTFQLKFFI